MTNTEATAELADLAARLIGMPYTGHTASGDPIRATTKIVGGYRVRALVIGWGDAEARFEVAPSNEALMIDEAAARIA